MAKSIGEVLYMARWSGVDERAAAMGVAVHAMAPIRPHTERPEYDRSTDEDGAKAVLLYALDLMAAAGVTSAEAAAQLRTGKTIEGICAERIKKTRGTEEQRAEFNAILTDPNSLRGPVVYQCPICLGVAMVVEWKDIDAHPTKCVVEIESGKVRAGKCAG